MGFNQIALIFYAQKFTINQAFDVLWKSVLLLNQAIHCINT
jgi:hypothetical protein